MNKFIKKAYRKLLEVANNKYKFVSLTSFKSYSIHHRDCYYHPTDIDNKTIVTPVKYVLEDQRPVLSLDLPERYISTLSDALIIGASNAVIASNCLLYDLLNDSNPRFRITDRGLFRVRNYPIHFNTRYLVCYSSDGGVIESGIDLSGNYSGNYYHFVYEFITKFYLINKYPIINEDVPFLCDEVVCSVPQLKEFLTLFIGNRKVVYLKAGVSYHINTLYYPSFVNMIPPNYVRMSDCRNEDILFDFNALDLIRQRGLSSVFGSVDTIPLPHKKFFISRSGTKWRQYNESEIIPILSDLNFDIIRPECLSLNNQIALYSRADAIVAASGAALTNILFCKPFCKILVLVSSRIDLSIYSSIAAHYQLDLEYLPGTIKHYRNVQSDYEIDTNKLSQVLNEFFGEKP